MSREAQLLQRIADLEEENHYLRSFITPVDTLPRSWKLSATQTCLVISLARAKGCLSKERIRLTAGMFKRDTSDKTLGVLLVRTRRALASRGVKIQTIRHVGMVMPPESRVIVLDALQAVAAGQVM